MQELLRAGVHFHMLSMLPSAVFGRATVPHARFRTLSNMQKIRNMTLTVRIVNSRFQRVARVPQLKRVHRTLYSNSIRHALLLPRDPAFPSSICCTLQGLPSTSTAKVWTRLASAKLRRIVDGGQPWGTILGLLYQERHTNVAWI